jgi:hypothetical protein
MLAEDAGRRQGAGARRAAGFLVRHHQQSQPAVEHGAAVLDGADRVDHGCQAAFHVGGAAAGEPVALAKG